MPTHDVAELFTPFFADLTDPRLERTKRHTLLDIIVLAVCATLGNADGWADIERFGKAKLDFFRTFLELPNGVPSHDTFGRVFARLDPAQLMACIQQWLDALGTAVAGEVVAIDGKTLRGSFDTAAATKSAASGESAGLADRSADAGPGWRSMPKSNESTAIPLLLELLDLKGWYRHHRRHGLPGRRSRSAIRGRTADYVLAVKDNQPSLHQAVQEAFLAYAEDGFRDPKLKHLKRGEQGHGREETREYFISRGTGRLGRRRPVAGSFQHWPGESYAWSMAWNVTRSPTL